MLVVCPCFQFKRGQNFPFDWSASVSNILTVRKWAEPKIVGRNFTSRIRPLSTEAVRPLFFNFLVYGFLGGENGSVGRKKIKNSFFSKGPI